MPPRSGRSYPPEKTESISYPNDHFKKKLNQFVVYIETYSYLQNQLRTSIL